MPPDAPTADAEGNGTAPDWVRRTPDMKGKICVVGIADPTFYRQDGLAAAADAGRRELGKTLQTKVSSVMLDESKGGGTNYVDESWAEEVAGYVSEATVSGGQALEYWFDANGSAPGGRNGQTYALVCMPTDLSVAQLAEKLAAAHPGEENKEKIRAVRDRAKSAFDELDKEENKRPKAGP